MRRLKTINKPNEPKPNEDAGNASSNNNSNGESNVENGGEQPVQQQQPAKPRPRTSPAQLRAQKDIQSMDAIPGIKLDWPDPDNFMHFTCVISPSEGLYAGTSYTWSITVPEAYPHEPPKCLLNTLPIYHPNIDWDGKPCLNILREDWRPVLTLGAVLQGLLFLYLEPNPYDPLNIEVADLMKRDEKQFEKNVALSLRGGLVDGRRYPQLLK